MDSVLCNALTSCLRGRIWWTRYRMLTGAGQHLRPSWLVYLYCCYSWAGGRVSAMRRSSPLLAPSRVWCWSRRCRESFPFVYSSCYTWWRATSAMTYSSANRTRNLLLSYAPHRHPCFPRTQKSRYWLILSGHDRHHEVPWFVGCPAITTTRPAVHWRSNHSD